MSKIDQAVKVATAFQSWEEMKTSMTKNGYCPTLRSDFGDDTFRNAVRIIRKECSRRGFRFYNGRKVCGK